ncbi:MAG: acyl-CoA dehydrogenase family protein [Pseudomonadota bacterium]
MSAVVETQDTLILSDLLTLTAEAAAAVTDVFATAKERARSVLVVDGRPSAALIEANQHMAHGLAWFATYEISLREMHAWANRLAGEGKLGEAEQLILQATFSEYLAQISGGIPMNQGEFIRPRDLLLTAADLAPLSGAAVQTFLDHGFTEAVKSRLADLLDGNAGKASFGDPGLDDTMEMIRDQFRRFSDEKVVPYAHEWHLKDELIPLEIIDQMAEMGVFGLTIPEQYGGSGMGKMAMCVVSEELSRGYIGVGSLGTRTEIAGELILCGGTEEQKQRWLPKLCSAEILPTAVFTEPNTGSDLGSLKTRAIKEGDVYKIRGNKTWITHGARTDLMTLLARTKPDETGYKGLSMFLAEKERGSCENPFPSEGMTGGEIEVLGYRGMKEYEIAFDDFEVKAENLLGQEEGKGFKQLMETFEGARIQTAARAVGVAQSALEIGYQYSKDRQQFGKALFEFPRVRNKLVTMAIEIMVARQLTYFSARQKDEDKRCDLEAGLAKLLGARVAWAAADNALQIHGGNGFALEYAISRVLCDARILNIFEGAAEIQAQVIARRLLET